MASPQIENGFTKIANELLDALCAVDLSGHEWKVVHAIIRKTYGYNKKEDWMTNTQIMLLTNQTQQKVSLAKKSLVEKKIVIENGNKISINKDYEKWNCQIKLPKTVTELPKTVTKVTENGEHKRKKTISKQISESTDSQGLQDNQNNMAWNRQPDDIEEGVVDLDSGEIKQPEKKVTRKYPNAPAVRKIFQEVLGRNPANWRINKTELLSCENLFTERGIEQIRSALEFYKEYKDREYCPVINSPYDLDSKWSNLHTFKKRL